MPTIEPLLERFRRHDRGALARLLTLISRGEHRETIRAALPLDPKPARVVAITGSGGVGKSTLLGQSIAVVRGRGRTVAVLACDPESPLTGGALLGDRVRMPGHAEDPGVFIRSVTAPEGHEGVADAIDLMIRLLEAFPFDVVLVETAGVGQGDTAVRELADVVVLLVQPEAGDELQWQKAGLLEVADVVVVHKADLPGAERTESEVRALLNLPGCRPVPVLQASAARGWGLEELWSAVESLPDRRSGGRHDQRALLRLAQQRLTDRFWQLSYRVAPVLERWSRREIDDRQAADTVLQALLDDPGARPR